MWSKFIALLLFSLFLLGVFIFFSLNPSYQKSYEAKFYYLIKDYKKAYEIANEAYTLNYYNRMAFNILTQSENNLKYMQYNEEAKEYLDKINKIVSKPVIDATDRSRIIMMCKIMIDNYKYVIKFKTQFTDDDLIEEITKNRDKFVLLESKITK